MYNPTTLINIFLELKKVFLGEFYATQKRFWSKNN